MSAPGQPHALRALLHLLLVALVLLSASGCKRRGRRASGAAEADSSVLARRRAQAAADSAAAAALRPDRRAEALARLGGLNIRNADFSRLAIKGTVRLEANGSTQRFNYRIHIEQGRRIWAVVTFLGIEGARLLATPEGCQVIYRLDRKVFLDGYGRVRDQLGFNVDYALLEDVLLANLRPENPFYAGHLLPAGASSPGLPGPPDLALQQHGTRVNYYLHSPEGCGCTRPGSIVVRDSVLGASSRLEYARWQMPENLLLPYLLAVDVNGPRTSRLVLEHREVTVNPAELTFSFAVPTDYEQVR